MGDEVREDDGGDCVRALSLITVHVVHGRGERMSPLEAMSQLVLESEWVNGNQAHVILHLRKLVPFRL